MRTLLDISDDMLALADMLEEVGGDLGAGDGALDEWFNQLGDERDTKLDNYAALIRDIELRAAARREESERLRLRVAADDGTVKRLKDRLKLFFEIQGIKKVETRRYAIGVQKNGGLAPLLVDDIDPADLPQWAQRVRIEVDTIAVRNSIEAGETVPFARFGERGTQLRIR